MKAYKRPKKHETDQQKRQVYIYRGHPSMNYDGITEFDKIDNKG